MAAGIFVAVRTIPTRMAVLELHDYADAQVIVVTAGAKQAPGESRLNLLQKNVAIVEAIVDDIVAQKSQAVLLLATNPVDILTYVALQRSG
jgi:L-lactate dehydrogenase